MAPKALSSSHFSSRFTKSVVKLSSSLLEDLAFLDCHGDLL